MQSIELPHTARVNSVDYDFSGKYVLCASSDTTVSLTEVDSRSVIETLGHEAPVMRAVFLPPTPTLSQDVVSALYNGELVFWRYDKGFKVVSREEISELPLLDLSCMKKDAVVACSSVDGCAYIVRLNEKYQKSVKKIEAHSSDCTSVSFVGEDKLLTAGSDSKVKLWDILGEPKLVEEFDLEEESPILVRAAPSFFNSIVFAVLASSGKLFLFNQTDSGIVRNEVAGSDMVSDMCWLKSGFVLAYRTEGGLKYLKYDSSRSWVPVSSSE